MIKKCPQCQTAYYDRTLEFCLEDGTKLIETDEMATVESKPATKQNNVETIAFEPFPTIPPTVEVRDAADSSIQTPKTETKLEALKQNAVEKGYRTLETSALVFALAHNWWQWLYVDRQNYGSVTNFLFSADFLIWAVLLIAGTVAGLSTLKFSQKKAFGYASLVILAINFILLIVPRK